MIKGELIQPLTIDVSAFKKRYNSLVGLSTYERANKLALERKRAAWAAYRPLERAQLYDTINDDVSITILKPLAVGAPRRSSKNGVMHDQTTVLHRPTEILAIIHALGLFKFDSEDPVIRQDPNKVVWYCVECNTFKPLTDFAKDRNNVHGIAFACKRCRDDAARRVYKRAA